MSPAAARRRRAGEGTHKGTSLMYDAGKSDHCVVPVKAPNKGNRGGAGGKAVDQGERNGRTHGPGAGPEPRVKGTTGRAGRRAWRIGC